MHGTKRSAAAFAAATTAILILGGSALASGGSGSAVAPSGGGPGFRDGARPAPPAGRLRVERLGAGRVEGALRARHPSARRPIGRQPASVGRTDVAPTPGPTVAFNGTNQAANPGHAVPATGVAAGLKDVVEVSNSRISVYSRAGGLKTTATLNSFFSYTSTTIYDPRVVYDPIWNRYVVAAIAPPESDGKQRLFVAASKTSTGSGMYWKYTICCVSQDSGETADFPWLGHDQDAVNISWNTFIDGGGATGRLAFLPKARLYNGLTLRPFSFFELSRHLPATIAPEGQRNTRFLVAGVVGSRLLRFDCRHTATLEPECSEEPGVSVPPYPGPQDAPQPGTADKIDTLDTRFIGPTYQLGDRLWNVHTAGEPSGPSLRVNEVDADGGFLFHLDVVSATADSADWNGTLAVNALGEVFVAYNSVDATGADAFPVQVRLTGRQATDLEIPPGAIVAQSPSAYDPTASSIESWGPYSSVALDPKAAGACAAGRRAWAGVEYAASSTEWANRIAQFRFC